MAKAQPMVYGVVIFRSDQQHIIVIESPDYDKCMEVWKKVHEEWAGSAKDLRPFILIDPIVTAFAPSMIYEVKLMPMISQDMAEKSHNPYQQRMNEQGFTRTFPGVGMDLLTKTGNF